MSGVYARPRSVAILGAGVQGARLSERLSRSSLFRVSAVFDPNPAAAASLAGSLGGKVCSSVNEALQLCDVAVAASPPKAHEEAARECAALRIPLLLEKPLAHDKESCLRISLLAKAVDCPWAVNFWMASSRVGEVVVEKGKALGPLRSLRLHARFETWPRAWQSKAGAWLASIEQGLERKRKRERKFFHFIFL